MMNEPNGIYRPARPAQIRALSSDEATRVSLIVVDDFVDEPRQKTRAH